MSVNLPANSRFVNSKKYFTPTRTIKTERCKSTGDHPLHHQFYPDQARDNYQETWISHHHNIPASKSKVLALENILETDDHKLQTPRSPQERFLPLESPSYRTLADIKTSKSRKYSSKTQSIDGFSQITQRNYFPRGQTSHQDLPVGSSDSEQTLTLTSSSSLSPQSLSSYSSIYEQVDHHHPHDPDETDLVDEFFLFPYDVLDADFEDICLELARFSSDSRQFNQAHLKAARASDEWNTLWIYRGKMVQSLSLCLCWTRLDISTK